MTAVRPKPPRPGQVEARIVATRLGYVAHLSWGVARLGEAGALPFAFTRRGIERKVRRIARQVEARADARARSQTLSL